MHFLAETFYKTNSTQDLEQSLTGVRIPFEQYAFELTHASIRTFKGL